MIEYNIFNHLNIVVTKAQQRPCFILHFFTAPGCAVTQSEMMHAHHAQDAPGKLDCSSIASAFRFHVFCRAEFGEHLPFDAAPFCLAAAVPFVA